MMFITGFFTALIGCVLCEWNSHRPYTWRDRWFPRVMEAGIGIIILSLALSAQQYLI